MTLTEQWKKGELPEGYYYIRNKAHSVKFDEIDYYMIYGENRYWHGCEDEDIEEVLAPVPSYVEWKNVTTCFDYEHKAYLSIVEEKQQLRKWCEEFNALDVAKENQRLQMSLRMTVDDYKNVVDICEQLKELLHSLKCCLTSQNIEPQIRVEKSLAKINEVLK